MVEKEKRWGKVKIKSNMAHHIQELESTLKMLSLGALYGEVWTTVEYAIYVEFGTYKMKPRAMVRRAMPAIEQKFLEEWQKLTAFPPTEADLRGVVEKTLDFAFDLIKENTPRKSGTLQDSWRKRIGRRKR